MTKASLQYHLDELEIARDPNRREHVTPPQPSSAAKILDIGCGAGQMLIARFPERVTFGIDVDHEALKLGGTLTNNVRFLRASAEALPYRSNTFDLVLARVSLPYTRLPESLAEIGRVLKPQGTLWVVLHPFRIPWAQVRYGSNFRGKLYFAYIALNSLLFHFVQRQFSVSGRCESFQTRYGMRRALEQRGFRDVRIEFDRHFVVTATKI